MRFPRNLPPRRPAFWRAFQFALCGAIGALPALASFELSRDEQRRMAIETKLTLEFLEQNHYRQMPFGQVDAVQVLKDYLRALDYGRLFLTQLDEQEILLRFGETIKGVYLAKGELYPAFEVFDIYRQRALARIAWVETRLTQPFDFTLEETYRPDRSEEEFPADPAAADALWEKRLKFELLQEILGGDSLERALEKITRRYVRVKRFVEEIEPHNVQETFLTAYAQLYDPHSNFFSTDSADEFTIAISNSLVGIGAVLRDEDGYCHIQELLPGGPAELSGQLLPGDKIIEVAQDGAEPVDVVDMKLRNVVKMIRGEKGTPVHLTVIPADATDPSERKIVTLIRDEIKLTENLASARLLEVPAGEDRTVPVGVIELPSFYGGTTVGGEISSSTSEDVEELLLKLKAGGAQGIVLDLRRNGGGLLSEAVKLAGLFIPKGPVVMVRNTAGKVDTNWDNDPKLVYDGPLVVLVSRHSASASEIVAGALQALQRAVIVGDFATHGKGTVQVPWDLNRSLRSVLRGQERLGTVKVTIQKFYLPNGSSTQNQGVTSDLVIPSFNEFLKVGESDLPNALVWDSITPVEWNHSLLTSPEGKVLPEGLREFLQERGTARSRDLAEFDHLRRQIARFKERQEEKEISVNLAQRRAQKELDEEFKDRMEAERKALAADAWPSRDVLLDLSEAKEKVHQEKLLSVLLPNGKPKINQYYQKTFYYQAAPGKKIHEVDIETLDYEKALKDVAALAARLGQELQATLPEEPLRTILQQFKSAERTADFQAERRFSELFAAHLSPAQLEALPSAFFQALIALDPGSIREEPELDIPLRESLRVVCDWLEFAPPAAQIPIAAREREETPSATPPN